MAADCSHENRQNRDVTTQARARARQTSRDEEEKEEKGESVEKRRAGSKEKHSGGRVGKYYIYISPVRYNPRFLLEIANVPESSFVRRRCIRSWRVSAREEGILLSLFHLPLNEEALPDELTN